MYLGWLADMVLIYGYTEPNKNSQTPVTGPGAVLPSNIMAWPLFLAVSLNFHREISYAFYSETLLKAPLLTPPVGPCLIHVLPSSGGSHCCMQFEINLPHLGSDYFSFQS